MVIARSRSYAPCLLVCSCLGGQCLLNDLMVNSVPNALLGRVAYRGEGKRDGAVARVSRRLHQQGRREPHAPARQAPGGHLGRCAILSLSRQLGAVLGHPLQGLFRLGAYFFLHHHGKWSLRDGDKNTRMMHTRTSLAVFFRHLTRALVIKKHCK